MTAANEIPSEGRCAACGSPLAAAVMVALPGGYYCPGLCTMQKTLDVLGREPVAASDRRLCQDAIKLMRAIRRARRV